MRYSRWRASEVWRYSGAAAAAQNSTRSSLEALTSTHQTARDTDPGRSGPLQCGAFRRWCAQWKARRSQVISGLPGPCHLSTSALGLAPSGAPSLPGSSRCIRQANDVEGGRRLLRTAAALAQAADEGLPAGAAARGEVPAAATQHGTGGGARGGADVDGGSRHASPSGASGDGGDDGDFAKDEEMEPEEDEGGWDDGGPPAADEDWDWEAIGRRAVEAEGGEASDDDEEEGESDEESSGGGPAGSEGEEGEEAGSGGGALSQGRLGAMPRRQQRFILQQMLKIKPTEPPSMQHLRKQFQMRVVDVNRTVKVTKGGGIQRYTAFVICGNGEGAVGFGKGKSAEVAAAVDKAYARSIRNLHFFERALGRTIPHAQVAKYEKTKVYLWPGKMDTGIRAGGTVGAILRLAGFKDVKTKVIGSRHPHNTVKATFKALSLVTTRGDAAAPEHEEPRRSIPLPAEA